MKTEYWVEAREGEEKMETGTCVPALRYVDIRQFPFVVMTSRSVSALGQLVCVCVHREEAETIAKALNKTKR